MPDDLDAAAFHARYLASMVSTIRGLRTAGESVNTIKRLISELHQKLPSAEAAIRAVQMELRRTRESEVRFGDLVKLTAHEAAVEMVRALNRERFSDFSQVIGRECWQVWPRLEEVSEGIEFETTRAKALRLTGSQLEAGFEAFGREATLKDRILKVLTPTQCIIMEHLWKKETASYDELAGLVNAWRGKETPNDSAITKALGKMRERIEADETLTQQVQLTVSTAGRRVNLIIQRDRPDPVPNPK